MLLSRAVAGVGDDDAAAAELEAARRTFAMLGAGPALRVCDSSVAHTLPSALTGRETEVLGLAPISRRPGMGASS